MEILIADGVDAIQIEIESTLRIDASKRDLFIEDLAYAIAALLPATRIRLRSPLFGAPTSYRGCSEGKSECGSRDHIHMTNQVAKFQVKRETVCTRNFIRKE